MENMGEERKWKKYITIFNDIDKGKMHAHKNVRNSTER